MRISKLQDSCSTKEVLKSAWHKEGIQLILVDYVSNRLRNDRTFLIQHIDTELPQHTGLAIEYAISLHLCRKASPSIGNGPGGWGRV